MAPLLSIRGLEVDFRLVDGIVRAVRGVSLDVSKGETLGIVGESGSGKSQLVLAAMGLLAANGRVRGSVAFDGTEIVGLGERALDRLRGRRMTMVFQEPMTSLDPLYRIGHQMALPMMRHQGLDRRRALARAAGLLAEVQIDNPASRLLAYPHELSGGQRQRVMIAMAIANMPDLVIADEPTTALDVTVEAGILDLLKDLQRRLGLAIVLISHDLNVVRRFADRVAVMHEGRVVEQGAVAAVIGAPREDYTRRLIAAEPEGQKRPVAADAPVLLEARNLRVAFRRRRRWPAPRPPDLVAVDGASVAIRQGETLGVVGESGSGKSTLGRVLLRLLPGSGEVLLDGRRIDRLDRASLRPLRRDLAVVFQDPFGSLSPRLTAGEIVAEGLVVHEPRLSRAERDRLANRALAEVGLEPSLASRYPHELSGGQRQRIAIARAMILRPRLVLLDEPTSALDRTVQKAVVELLRGLQERHGLTYVFISHDLAVVRALADRIVVMKDGRIIEEGPAEAVLAAPRADYTRCLISAAFRNSSVSDPPGQIPS
jgi:oligopeptide transport system ATP-binding protein